MKRIIRYIGLVFLTLNSGYVSGQDDFFLSEDVSQKIDFQFTSNLIIIPVDINGVTLSFVLDTGVSKPILFNLSERDSLDLKNAETFYLHGLGANGKLEALKSSQNNFKIGDAVNNNQDVYVVYDGSINFTSRIGVLVHGIVGYDIFKNFIVEINYSSKYIRLYKPEAYRPKSSKKWKAVPINIHKRKPYLDATVTIDKEEKPVKLLIDTGSSDALWLFEDREKGLEPNNDKFFVDYLGTGLSGSVYGKRSKVNKFKLSDFNLENANVAFPDSVSIDVAKVYKERNGSLGGDILKRFNLFFDYGNSTLYLKRNSNFKDPFTYNNSGIVLEHNGTIFVKEEIKVPSYDKFSPKNNYNAVQIDFSINYIMKLKPAYKIVEIRASSNAYKAGLRVGDVLININGKHAYDYKLPEINKIFHGSTGKSIRMRIERGSENLLFKFKLDDAFKKNELSI